MNSIELLPIPQLDDDDWFVPVIDGSTGKYQAICGNRCGPYFDTEEQAAKDWNEKRRFV